VVGALALIVLEPIGEINATECDDGTVIQRRSRPSIVIVPTSGIGNA